MYVYVVTENIISVTTLEAGVMFPSLDVSLPPSGQT